MSDGLQTCLSAGDPDAAGRLIGEVAVKIEGKLFAFQISVPDGPVAPEDLMPVFGGIVDAVVAAAVARVEAAGKAVSCRAGCSACCRQYVPVSGPEARAIATLVMGLPEPRRTTIRARFAAVLERLTRAGLLERIDRAHDAGDADFTGLGLAYFRLGLECPFLEDNTCSIHPSRPLACREYLVTSPAANCAQPTAEAIDRAPVTLISNRLAAATRGGALDGRTVLVNALRFAESAPAPVAKQGAPQIIRDVLDWREW